jgi:hypothetical protein
MNTSSMNKVGVCLVGLLTVSAVGCGGDSDDDDSEPQADAMMGEPDTAEEPDTMGDPDTGDDMEGDAGMDAGETGGATEFQVTLENISGDSSLPTPFAPGTWAVHTSDNPFFEPGSEDPPEGLEQLAEDGGGGTLASTIEGGSGITSVGAFAPDPPGPITPGNSFSFSVEAEPSDGNLSLASMFVQSNDLFVAPESGGIPLFDDQGNPLESRDVSDQFAMWDAGTERNQAPGFGRDQAPRQDEKGDGAEEGVISEFNGATRALPVARGVVDVSVSQSDGTYTVTVENASASRGAIVTPVAPVFYAVHNTDWSFYTAGEEASGGLETLAEDGSPMGLVDAHSGDDGTKTVAAATTATGADEPGPAGPGQAFEFDVEPNSSNPHLSLAAMVVETNDAFLGLNGGPVPLMEDGEMRSAADVQAEIRRRLAIWDAGTEANQVPGAGTNQAPRQDEAGQGPTDPNSEVRPYADSTNDLSGEMAGGFLDLSVQHGSGDNEFDVTVTNTSDEIAYTGAVTPVLWATTQEGVALFETGTEASSGLESLAEDGDPSGLAGELPGDVVGSSGVLSTPTGAEQEGPLMPGDSYKATITVDSSTPQLHVASMVVPSNDTFVALGETGISLLDDSGNRRAEGDIASDIVGALSAYNAGTEADQAGAAGPDQAPRQEAPDTGPAEGNGTVHSLMDPVWSYPTVDEVLRVTVEPTN